MANNRSPVDKFVNGYTVRITKSDSARISKANNDETLSFINNTSNDFMDNDFDFDFNGEFKKDDDLFANETFLFDESLYAPLQNYDSDLEFQLENIEPFMKKKSMESDFRPTAQGDTARVNLSNASFKNSENNRSGTGNDQNKNIHNILPAIPPIMEANEFNMSRKEKKRQKHLQDKMETQEIPPLILTPQDSPKAENVSAQKSEPKQPVNNSSFSATAPVAVSGKAAVPTQYSDISSTTPKKEGIFTRIIHYLFPSAGDSKGEVIRKLGFLIAFVTLIVCAALIFSNLYESYRNKQQSEEFANEYVYGDSATTVPRLEDMDPEEYSKSVEELQNDLPEGVTVPDQLQPAFFDIYKKNQDIIGWIYMPGTTLNHPVMQSGDNIFYLRHDQYKKSTKFGAPFMDYRASVNPLSENCVIYGHHVKDGSMFTPMDDYRQLSGYKKNPVLKFDTIYQQGLTWKVFATILTNAYPDQDNGYTFNYMTPNFAGEANFNAFIDAVNERSFYSTDVDVKYGDRILTLSTCNYDFTEARLVVMARLVREGESEEVNVNAAKLNSNQRFPQAYYDKMKKDNPFKNADRWTLKTNAEGQKPTKVPESTFPPVTIDGTTAASTQTTKKSSKQTATKQSSNAPATNATTRSPATQAPSKATPTVTTTAPSQTAARPPTDTTPTPTTPPATTAAPTTVAPTTAAPTTTAAPATTAAPTTTAAPRTASTEDTPATPASQSITPEEQSE